MVLLLLLTLNSQAEQSVRITLVADLIDNQRQLNTLDLSSRIFVHLQEQLSDEMQVSYERADRTREWLLLNKRPDVCLYNKIKTSERMEQGLFTKVPMSIFPANRLVISKKHDIPQQVSISEAIHQYNLKIGVVAGRSYGQGIDQKIFDEKENLAIIRGEYGAARLRSMLLQGKVDGIIEYEDVFFAEIGQEKASKLLSFIEVSDVPPYIFGYIACSKSDQGAKAIKMLDRLLLTEKIHEMIIEEHKKEFSSFEKSRLLAIYQQAAEY